MNTTLCLIAGVLSIPGDNLHPSHEDLIDRDWGHNAVMPPLANGTILSYQMDDDTKHLFSATAFDSPPARISTSDGAEAFWPSPCETLLVVKGQHPHGDAQRVFLYNVREKKLRTLPVMLPARKSKVVWNRQSSGFFLEGVRVEKTPTVFFDLELMELSLVYHPEVSASRPVCVSNVGTHLLVEEDGQDRIVEVEIATGVTRTLPRHSTVGWYYPISYSMDDASVIIEHRSVDSDVSDSIVVLDRAKHTISKEISVQGAFSRERYARSQYHPKMNMFAGIRQSRGSQELVVVDVESERIVDTSHFPVGVYRSPLFRGQRLYYIFSGVTAPYCVYGWDPRSPMSTGVFVGKQRKIPLRIKQAISQPNYIQFPSFDGQEIGAFVYPPVKHGKNFPAAYVILLHGGPRSHFTPSYRSDVLYFLTRGIGVFAPNFRGSIGYEPEFERLDNGLRRLGAVKDVVAGAKWLMLEKGVKAKHLGVSGKSYGGYLAVWCAIQEPTLFSAVYAGSPIVDLNQYVADSDPSWLLTREDEFGSHRVRRLVSPIHHASTIRLPLLITHGIDDTAVSIKHARQLYESVSKKNSTCTIVEYEGEGHTFKKRSSILDVRKRVSKFFESHLLQRDE
jgi:dipeptidyl aminopeptidase/acylaminoacyl peptidase